MVKNISREELLKLINSGKEFRLVDARNREAFEKEHIKGAISLPVNEIEEKAKKLLKENELIVTYCSSFECPASTEAAKKLFSLGFKHVVDYKGGLKDYKEVNLSVSTCRC